LLFKQLPLTRPDANDLPLVDEHDAPQRTPARFVMPPLHANLLQIAPQPELLLHEITPQWRTAMLAQLFRRVAIANDLATTAQTIRSGHRKH